MPPVRPAILFSSSHREVPGHDTGIADAIVRAVGAGSLPEAVRIHETADILAFGRHDTITPGYPSAVAAARAAGFTPVERLAGGRAAVFHGGTLAFSWAIPASEPRSGVGERFQEIAEIMTEAFGTLGVDARIGELEGEYCPGAYSVHAGDMKIMGVGQRLVRGAAHVGGVVSVLDGSRIRDVLIPVYRELGLEWRPSTAGALDELVPDVTLDRVRDAIVESFSARLALRRLPIPPEIVDEGRNLAESHLPGHEAG